MTFRVLHIINRASGSGGAEVSLRDIVVGLSGSSLTQGLAVLAPDGNQLEAFEAANIQCFVPEAAPRGRWDHLAHVHRAIRTFRPDLVHTTLFDADLAGRLTARIAGVPVVSSLVNTPYGSEVVRAEPVAPWKLRLVRQLDRLLARWATSGFHAISTAAAEHAVDYLGVPPVSIRVVPRGRSIGSLGRATPERRTANRGRLGWADRPVVLNVARQEPQKGQLYLIDAFPAVLAIAPDALLVIAGREGRSTAALLQRIAKLDLEQSVEFLGARSDVPDLLASADVFAFPSLYEGLGGAVVEAMAFGLPIVATDIPALREVLQPDRGWLVPAGDAGELAAALSGAIVGGDAVRARAAKAREAFLEHYRLELCVDRMRALYRDIEEQLQADPGHRWRIPRLCLDEPSPRVVS
jgi:glycosyltransferase involved in cell wall biosynthesis